MSRSLMILTVLAAFVVAGCDSGTVQVNPNAPPTTDAPTGPPAAKAPGARGEAKKASID